jgi:hypothetical protein
MKKSVIKISLAFGIIAALVLVLVGLRSIDGGGTAPSYSFLGGRNPVKWEKAKTGNEDRRYTYSFEADFNDLCSKAHAELTPAGFAVRSDVQILSGKKLRYLFYYLKEKFPRGLVHIYIYDSRQYIDLQNLYNNIPKSNYAVADKDGWVTVEIIYGRGWRWPF